MSAWNRRILCGEGKVHDMGGLSALDRKLLRDLGRLWAQAVAVALVMACGVATLILAIGAYRSLEETRAAYYERYRFGDIFASATRAPQGLADRIAEIPGVMAVQTRISQSVILDIDGMREPATGIAISIPDHAEPLLNRLYLRRGRLPDVGRADEVTVNEPFAQAHGFSIGDRFRTIIDGTRRTLVIVGVALSPEYVYALGPGDMVPDSRRFGVLWMSEKALAAITDRIGAFNSVSLSLMQGANETEVIARLDRLLARYGGTGAYDRADQMSNAFLDSELKQLRAMARIIPPIFLLVSAFLINMVLTRLIALEREQIGLMKAIGYSSIAIAWHYLKLVIAISVIGIAIGTVAGTFLGRGMTRLYGEFFSFPFLIFRQNLDIYAIAGGISVAAAMAGALRAISATIALAPAVAMQPAAPTVYRQLWGGYLHPAMFFSQLTVMALRHLIRRPARSLMTILGISLACALLVTALFTIDSVDSMIETVFFRTERQDATLTFAANATPSALQSAENLPGIVRAEPFLAASAVLRNGQYSKRMTITGKPPESDLSRVLDPDFNAITMPENGLALSQRVANQLRLKRGDMVEVSFQTGRRRTLAIPVTEIVETLVGLAAYMDINALSRVMLDGPRMSGVHIAIDASQLDALYAKIKTIPVIMTIALQGISKQQFRETIEKNITIMVTVYVTLAVIIAFGVVYNSARIQLSERARELASLRVLGFTRSEVAHVLRVELATMLGLAVPLGWLIGYLFAWATIQGFASDLFRVPFVVDPATFAVSGLVVIGASALSWLIVRQRINRLDMIRVLKTRE